MRVSVETLLPLQTWAEIMGVSPWEMGQVGFGFPVPNLAQCEHIFFQYAWQQDFLSREEVASAISKAEEAIAEELNYWPAPKWITNEVQLYPRPAKRQWYGAGGTPRGQYKAVQLNWGKVQGAGILARTSIGTAAVVLSDKDGDGINDTFTVSIATAVTDTAEIGIYFKSADRNGEAIDETWRIRPITVSISGGTATITGHPALLVIPDLTTTTDPQILDVTDNIYVTEVEVYRVYRDTTATEANQNQGSALWETQPGCDGIDCVEAASPICVGYRNAEMGQVLVDYHLDGICPPRGYEPDRVRVSYLAGEPLVNGKMARHMAEAVAYLATSLLPVDKCGCERSARIIAYWRALPNEGESNRPITSEEVNNIPWEPRRGGLYAWNRIKNLRQQWAVLV